MESAVASNLNKTNSILANVSQFRWLPSFSQHNQENPLKNIQLATLKCVVSFSHNLKNYLNGNMIYKQKEKRGDTVYPPFYNRQRSPLQSTTTTKKSNKSVCAIFLLIVSLKVCQLVWQVLRRRRRSWALQAASSHSLLLLTASTSLHCSSPPAELLPGIFLPKRSTHQQVPRFRPRDGLHCLRLQNPFLSQLGTYRETLKTREVPFML